jgi:hypothetical protein
MTIQPINLGNIVNDGLGDDLRTAFQKVNANFTDLSNTLTVTASNLGTVGESVFSRKQGVDLQFKKLIPGTKITMTSNDESIIINSTATNSFSRFTTNLGYVDSDDYQVVTLQGDHDVNVTAVAGVITVSTILDLNQILTVLDFGGIKSTPTSIPQMNTALSNIDFGTFSDPSGINYDLGVFGA